MAGGVGLFGYALWRGLSHVTDGLVQVVVPGDAELSLKHEQLYTVFLESQSVVNGKIYSTNGSVNGLECRVKSAASACSYGNTGYGPETVVAVGSGVTGRIIWTVFAGLLAMFGGCGSGLIIFGATFVLRKNARARLAVPNPALTGQP
jgi:hypothetical protein